MNLNNYNLALNYVNRVFNIYIFNNLKLYSNVFLTYICFTLFSYELYIFNMVLFNYIYWFILGILSTIGLGFGFHTGIFFLFPYITNYYDISNNPSIFNTLIKCLPTIIIWGMGSAIGELPPYYLALKCDKSNFTLIKSKRLNKIYNYIKSKIDCYNKALIFPSIILLSSWPNATFDMCGLVCGYYRLTFKEFLYPTIIGKSLIKAPIQSFIVLYLYTHESNYSLSQYSPVSLNILFNICFVGLLCLFIHKSINHLAKLELEIQKKSA